MKRRGPVIAIDGPSGVGKSSISRLLAKRLNLRYIDTGAMYRAVALRVSELSVDIDSEEDLRRFCSRLQLELIDEDSCFRVYVDKEDYTNKIRSPLAGRLASLVSSKKAVRERLVEFQRALGRGGGVILEGRDIGTVVFPDADIKFFLEANLETRIKRRYKQLRQKGEDIDIQMIEQEIRERDYRDITRKHSPLKRADDAISIDTSHKTLNEVYKLILSEIEERLGDALSLRRDRQINRSKTHL